MHAALPMSRERWEGHLRWALLFLGLFLATHWQEVTSPTLNVDDWDLVLEPIRQASLSRPAWDLIYGILFQHSFSPFLGWLLAAASLYGCALAVTVFAPGLGPAWVCLLALLTASHTYLLDLFNFSFCIGLYLLPAALSLWGAVLMGHVGGAWRLGAWVGGVALFCFAMGIYQPTGYLGIAVPGLQALSLALGLRRFPPNAGPRVVAGVIVGGVAYYLWARLAMAGMVANERTAFADLGRFLEKISDLPVYREIYNTSVPVVPPTPQLLLSLTFLLILLGASLRLGHRCRGRERIDRLGWLWLAAAILFLLPLGLFFLLRTGFPSRAFSMGNYGIASFAVVVLASWYSPPWLKRLSQACAAFLCVAVVLPQAVAFSKVWDRQQLLERRDAAMAHQIVADVRSEARRTAHRQEPFAIFGVTARTEIFPHWSSVGQSAFTTSWSIPALFRNLEGVQVEHLTSDDDDPAAGRIRASLPSCRAYPEPGSIVPYGDRLLVCLEPNPAVPPGRTPSG